MRIAGYLHDIGNVANRCNHAQMSAMMAYHLLDRLGMPVDEICDVVTAIGNHDESTGLPITPMAAAIIIGDKTDVRRNRVRYPVLRVNDIHDRVNGAVGRRRLLPQPRGEDHHPLLAHRHRAVRGAGILRDFPKPHAALPKGGQGASAAPSSCSSTAR